eukprot:SAG22_NODE_10724_length_519_cov_1.230952_1_plen_36_part_10
MEHRLERPPFAHAGGLLGRAEQSRWDGRLVARTLAA